ncbi:MAG: LUD domain-containing protein [Rhodocyclaceae bacterium]|nr:LUD domain-containing protein [Rhodocyclaceae bacterium]
MEDAWALLREEKGSLPRAVNFVSGPSRTADIEQTVTMGAHGPYRVHHPRRMIPGRPAATDFFPGIELERQLPRAIARVAGHAVARQVRQQRQGALAVTARRGRGELAGGEMAAAAQVVHRRRHLRVPAEPRTAAWRSCPSRYGRVWFRQPPRLPWSCSPPPAPGSR